MQLTEINSHLSAMQLPTLTTGGLSALIQEIGEPSLHEGLGAARNDRNAWRQLGKFVDMANSVALGGGNAGHQQRNNQQSQQQNNQSHSPVSNQGQAQQNVQQQRPSESKSGGGQEREYGPSMHIYGGRAALCFSAGETSKGIPTIFLDGAPSSGPRQYNWGQKIVLQMTRAELPVVCCVLLGLLPSCEFKSHGPAKTKGFSVEHQGKNIFIKIWDKDKPAIAVPVSPEDAFFATGLCLKQLNAGADWMSQGDVMNLLRAVVAPMKAASNA